MTWLGLAAALVLLAGCTGGPAATQSTVAHGASSNSDTSHSSPTATTSSPPSARPTGSSTSSATTTTTTTATTSSPSSSTGTGATVDVAIGDNDYDPAVVSVKPGDTVRWTNHGGAAHTVTADGGDFDSGTLAPGAVFTHKFPVLGSFPYHCTIHGPAMAGSVVVSSK